MLRLGVTREANLLTTLSKSAKDKGVEIIPLPLTKITPLPFDLPENIKTSDIDWLIFTSHNGARSFFNYCQEKGWKISADTKIAAIGNKTKESIESFGFSVDFIPSKPYGTNLFKEFIQSENIEAKNIIYPQAEVVISEPQTMFKTSKADFYDIICYRTEENRCREQMIERFTSDDYIFFTAPSSVHSYQHQFGNPKAKLIAIGQTTAKAIEKENWKLNITLDKPEIEKVLEYI